MDKFINPTIYKKESVEINGSIVNGLYFKDDNERDWYETLPGWKGAIAVNASGIVCAYESDASYMGMEEGRSVYEVDPAGVPENVIGNYSYSEDEFTDVRPSVIDLANRERSQLMQQATIAMSALQDAADLGIATDEEAALLTEWKQYRVGLNRIDTSTAPDIDWPEPPTTT